MDPSLTGREGAIYDGNPVIMGIWVDSYCAGAVLNMSLFLVQFLWAFFFVTDGQSFEVVSLIVSFILSPYTKVKMNISLR